MRALLILLLTATLAAAQYTPPPATQTVNSAGGVLTITGPTGAHTITVPDANFSVARTDASQEFTGNQFFTGVVYLGPTTSYASVRDQAGRCILTSGAGVVGLTASRFGPEGTVLNLGEDFANYKFVNAWFAGTVTAVAGTFSGAVTVGGGTAIAKHLSSTATLDFGSTAAGASTDLTITVTGAAVGDTVTLGVPNGSVVANGSFSAWVSAADTVTARFINSQLVGATDPASGAFRSDVWKH